MAGQGITELRRVKFTELSREPFRVFFPIATMVGILGVSLWPLHFMGVVSLYPGQAHARVMAYGMFGGFIIGFMGTALPRMLSAPPLRHWEVVWLLFLHLVTSLVLLWGNVPAGDRWFLGLLASVIIIFGKRVWQRKDLPPPGFALVGLAWLCMGFGTVLALLQEPWELSTFWSNLQHLLSYQGFVLLPILGVGAFILPRFFGRPSPHDFPESLRPPPGWTSKAVGAIMVALIIIVSFVLEATGWFTLGPAIRLVAAAYYLVRETPVFRRAQPGSGRALVLSLRIAFGLLLAGFVAITAYPEFRVSLLHFTLIGGFAVVTLIVATRVIFGHSGNQPLLTRRNAWLYAAVGFMILGMTTRISGDFWPKVMQSHYIYGAIAWIIGIALWGVYVLPKVRLTDPDE